MIKKERFLHQETKLDADEVVHVELAGNEVNVALLDDANWELYRNGKPCDHQAGGHVETSPVVLRPPFPGTWHLIIDLGGGVGEVTAKIKVRKG